ncbi:MAG: hypothetical protein KAS65_01095 [Candidatus Aminicenantes bacterium]|nr:hypothetical protein [Candidatus Aminicenantes bacterium]
MKSTLYPEIIYGTFERYGFPVLRIDHFDRGDYAEIRAELDYPGFLSVKQLQEITMKLNLMEKNEGIQIQIVNVDMIHKTMRVNISIEA